MISANRSIIFKIAVIFALMAYCLDYALAQRKSYVTISLEKYEFRRNPLSLKDSVWLDSLLLRDKPAIEMIKAADLGNKRIIDIVNEKNVGFFTLHCLCQKYVFHKVSRDADRLLTDSPIVTPQTDYLIFIDTDSQTPIGRSLMGYFVIRDNIIFISRGVSLPFLERTAEKAAFKTYEEEDLPHAIGDVWYFPQWIILCRNNKLMLLKKEVGDLPQKNRMQSSFENLGEMSFQ